MKNKKRRKISIKPYKRFGRRKKKLLACLLAGVAAGLTQNFPKQLWILKQIPKGLESIDREYLKHLIKEFYEERLIEFKEYADGTQEIYLSEDGKLKALRFHPDIIEKPTGRWDGNRRFVIYDIPEKFKKIRNIFRDCLKSAGFIELQKSVWVCPFECEDQINFFVENLSPRPFVRYCVVKKITNEASLKLKFDLL